MNWLIATPAWGERCVGLFLETTLPAIVAAAVRCSGRVRFVVHTDVPQKISEAFDGVEIEVLPVPPGKTSHVCLGEAHREAISMAREGECIAFINADMTPSVEVFEAAERRFAQGKRMIMMAASRTIGTKAPVGASSADLLRWTMEHRHPSIVECFWGTGRSTVPWAVYFQSGESVVLRGFHLHPFASVKDRELRFDGKTIDANLADSYSKDQIHLVTSADEASFAEHSPPERVFDLRDRISVSSVAGWAKDHATPLHRWFFTQRIAIVGDGRDIGDGKICDAILRRL